MTARTDDELLALAAKAGRIDTSKPWNALTNSGEAFDLAVRLGLLFGASGFQLCRIEAYYMEALDADMRPTEAARHAIVKAAAMIGASL